MKTVASIRTKVDVPLAGGSADFISFKGLVDPAEHIALGFGDWKNNTCPLVRVHSECLTGDIFASQKCDCGPQLQEALKKCRIENGIILYLRQEGRGIGLYNKLDAYTEQTKGADTYEANRLIHQPEDARSFEVAAQMLQALNITQIKLLTNNPQKAEQLKKHGIKVVETLPTDVYITPHNAGYLKAKRDQHNHTLKLTEETDAA